jgi:hypothetical protein
MRINEIIRYGVDIDKTAILGKNVHRLFDEILDLSQRLAKLKMLALLRNNTVDISEDEAELRNLVKTFITTIDKTKQHLIGSVYPFDLAKRQEISNISKTMKIVVTRRYNNATNANVNIRE